MNASNSENLSRHAVIRSGQRGITAQDIEDVLTYGREVRSRGRNAFVYLVGRKEIDATPGVDLEHLEGVHVLLSLQGLVITVYHDRELCRVKSAQGRYRNLRRGKANAKRLPLRGC